MPIVATSAGWVKTPPRPSPRQVNPTKALIGPLAYFAGRADLKRPQPKQLLLTAPPKPKNRIVSEPLPRPRRSHREEVIVEEDTDSYRSRSPSPPRKHKRDSYSRHRESRPRHETRSHHEARPHREYEHQPPPVVIYQTAPHHGHHDRYNGRQAGSSRATSYSWFNATQPLNL